MATEIAETVYTFLRAYMAKHQRPPSIREIAAGCYMGKSTVTRGLDILEARGLIRRVAGQARSITLLEAEAQPEK